MCGWADESVPSPVLISSLSTCIIYKRQGEFPQLSDCGSIRLSVNLSRLHSCLSVVRLVPSPPFPQTEMDGRRTGRPLKAKKDAQETKAAGGRLSSLNWFTVFSSSSISAHRFMECRVSCVRARDCIPGRQVSFLPYRSSIHPPAALHACSHVQCA